jgi:hypothetical protein
MDTDDGAQNNLKDNDSQEPELFEIPWRKYDGLNGKEWPETVLKCFLT